jgi:hypothetical protein
MTILFYLFTFIGCALIMAAPFFITVHPLIGLSAYIIYGVGAFSLMHLTVNAYSRGNK